MSGVLSVSLSSTPPLATPSPVVRGGSGKRGAAGNVVSFRSGLPEDGPLAGSLKSGGLSRSLTEGLGAASLGRSLSRSRTASGEGLQSSSAAPASAARPLQSTKSIPKSAAFVKIEGFDTAGFDAASPAASPPPSPQQPRTLSSLLSRQLSTDRLPGLAGSPSLASPLASPGLPEEPLGGLVSRLEAAVRVAPVPRPPQLHPARRGTVPDNLLKQLQEQHSVFSEPVCVRAFSIARFAHDGKYRASGEPAFMHCVEVARILAELGAGEATVAAALLHDVLDKTLLVEGQLRPMLQDDGVADLVKQVAHLGDVSSKYRACPATSPEGQTATASALVGMLVAMGANGALLVKLADRLHDMRTLDALPAAKRNRLARETIDVWAPLANRLGVWSLKAQLEDLAFKQLFPAQFAELRDRLAQVQSAGVLVSLCDKLRTEMQRQDISYHDLSGRPKHLWGVFKKMTSKNYSLSRISDVRGLRIIVESKADCYRALRAVEAVWKSVGPTKDYIRRPKENGYRSLHTVVRGEDGHDIEVQIRTAKMHFFAEYGSEAAHWQYKERGYGSGAAGSSPAATAGAVGPAATISSLDEDQPTAAGARSAGAGDAAREANWAKFVLSQQVSDQKFRPSGSPTQDHSLAHIVGAATAPACASGSGGEDESPSGSPPKDERFAAYLERSGQKLEPPPAERVVVAVVHNGGLHIEEMPEGTTVAGLLSQRGLTPREAQVLVNSQVEGSTAAVLRTGDIVELWCEPVVPVVVPGVVPAVAAAAPVAATLPPRSPARLPAGAARGNVVPLGALKARAATTAS
ncbi:putative GTP diphosphokinase chloroplastic [Chlorella sorokiniana]|uniref:GTP diphosphokinase chloroplastic n=1 Tax=Chlorella sorokiniana TaxID=3076 RepID=A0A2P6TIG2_CHLSO|nr:putative GTP diphosphokinase chloroplastic [Chlorella sorokiniana]|eukprot:PRW34085.1 putative GTP diphosphokinase chloroplastic [Chlorella sorokiniana]